jgi:hypothetical protein
MLPVREDNQEKSIASRIHIISDTGSKKEGRVITHILKSMTGLLG